MKCRICNKNALQIGGYLTRVNRKGVPGVWECRPTCGADLPSDTKFLMAIDGSEVPKEPTMSDVKLLPLPEPFAWANPGEAETFKDGEDHHFTALRYGMPAVDTPVYDAGQMEAYTRACIEADRKARKEKDRD